MPKSKDNLIKMNADGTIEIVDEDLLQSISGAKKHTHDKDTSSDHGCGMDSGCEDWGCSDHACKPKEND